MALKRSHLRDALFGIGFAILVFAAVNEAVELAERAGWLNTHGRDAAVQTVDERLFERRRGRMHTTEYAEQTLVRSSFAARKGKQLRLFLLGGSFAMGSPYRLQHAADRGGGIDGFLRFALDRHVDRQVEVMNVAAGGQNSTRVVEIAREVVRYEPDALIVATCNNEGEPPPSEVIRWLRKQGAFRLLRNALRPEPSSVPAGSRDQGHVQGPGAAGAARPWFTVQDPDTASIRATFSANLAAIVELGREHDVPVLLATLPVNLTYRGFDTGGHVTTLQDERSPEAQLPPPTQAGYPVPPIPPDFADLPPCPYGVVAFEAGHPEVALPMMRACIEGGGAWPRLAGFLRSYVALAELELGLAHRSPTALRHLEQTWGPCVAEGIVALHTGDPGAAARRLRGCERSPEALRWLGLALREEGETEAARVALEQSVELSPRNRCRPSFNRLVRQVAAENPDVVTLVDLEEAARRVSPDGLPGTESFIDYCHMNWRGYGAMAGAILEALPAVVDLPAVPLSVERAGMELGLPGGDNRDQVLTTSNWIEGGYDDP